MRLRDKGVGAADRAREGVPKVGVKHETTFSKSRHAVRYETRDARHVT
jgi:hypothetical protein